MGSWLRRHGFALAAVSVATFLGSVGLDHHSPARDWVVRAVIFGAIVLAAYLVCSSQIELINRANHSRRGKAIIVLAVILGATAPRVGDGAIVAVAGVIVGAVIALDRAGLMLKRTP
jgi:hypothetical protein